MGEFQSSKISQLERGGRGFRVQKKLAGAGEDSFAKKLASLGGGGGAPTVVFAPPPPPPPPTIPALGQEQHMIVSISFAILRYVAFHPSQSAP